VGLLVPNLFIRIPVETAVRGCEAIPVVLACLSEAPAARCSVVVVDLDAPKLTVPAAVSDLVARGIQVLAFAPHVEAEVLAAARRAGAVAMPRSALLRRLPSLLRLLLEDPAGPES
jgi:hypothetical protein